MLCSRTVVDRLACEALHSAEAAPMTGARPRDSSATEDLRLCSCWRWSKLETGRQRRSSLPPIRHLDRESVEHEELWS